MNLCYFCNNAAQAICKFCGKFICKSHIKKKKYFSGFTAFWGWMQSPTALKVADASWCGNCKVEARYGS